jgi:hypothetical protein
MFVPSPNRVPLITLHDKIVVPVGGGPGPTNKSTDVHRVTHIFNEHHRRLTGECLLTHRGATIRNTDVFYFVGEPHNTQRISDFGFWPEP